MPRKRKEINYECYNKPFPSILRKLMKENNTTQQELGDAVGKKRQCISYYCDGSSSPDLETLAKIANYFSVSVDWLIGLSPVRTSNADLKAVCDYTGLSEASIGSILRETANEETRNVLNTILSFDPNSFHRIIQNAQKGISIEKKYMNKLFNWELIPEEVRQELFDYFDVDPEKFENPVERTRERFFRKATNYLKIILLEYLVSPDGKPMFEEDDIEEGGDSDGND